MKNDRGKELIEELLSDPALFFKEGKSYHLLTEYFNGFPLETLISLLQSNNEDILKSSIWIVSELANQACSLLSYIIPLVDHQSSYIRYYSLECVLLCSQGRDRSEFIHLIQAITDNDETISMLVMRLLSNAEKDQLELGVELVEKRKIINYKIHQKGLLSLLYAKEIDDSEILNMLIDENGLIQQYGAMLIKRKGGDNLNMKLINEALVSSNPIVRDFAITLRDF